MIKSDFHVHSNFSTDSQVTPRSQIEIAFQKGFTHIAITDHNDFEYPSRITGPEYTLDFDSYVIEANKLKEEFKNKIKVLLGCEFGLEAAHQKEIKEVKAKYNFDFIIGSSHLINGVDPTDKNLYLKKSENEVYREYFESILVNTSVFTEYSVYGHLDYVTRYGPTKNLNFKFSDYAEIFEQILKNIIKNGKGIEINTSGFLRDLGYPHPHIEILKMYKNLGGEILTFGSDSHKNETIGYMFDESEEIVKNLGFKYYCIFENLKPIFIKF